ncbi:hypothetical protein ES703_14885 [subsurface metagenome]
MPNSFNISVKPEIAAVKAVVDANSVILIDVHDTDLPAVKTDTGYILTGVTSIHDVLLPAVVAEINDNETKIDSVKTVVDVLRSGMTWFGELVSAASNDNLQTILDVSGEGFLHTFFLWSSTLTDLWTIHITIDGTLLDWDSNSYTAKFKGDESLFQNYVSVDSTNLGAFPIALESVTTPEQFSHFASIKFNSTLLIQVQRTIGGTAASAGILQYSIV